MIYHARALLGVLASAFCLLLAQPAAAQEKFSLCWVSFDATYGPLYYAHEKGYFAKYGLQTSMHFVEGGPRGVQAIVGGSVDMCINNGAALVHARLADLELRAIGMQLGLLPGKILAAKDITRPEQLKGKRWGIAAFGGESHVAMQLYLDKVGLKESDVVPVQLGSTANRFAALEAGQIQVSTFNLPLLAKVESLGYTVMASLPELAGDYFSTGITVSSNTLRTRRPALKGLLSALAEATVAYKKDRDGGIEVIKKYTKSNDEDAALAWAYFAPLNPINMRPSPASIQFFIDRSSEPRAKTIKPDEIYDLSLLNELEQSGFFAKLTQ